MHLSVSSETRLTFETIIVSPCCSLLSEQLLEFPVILIFQGIIQFSLCLLPMGESQIRSSELTSGTLSCKNIILELMIPGLG